MNEENMASAMPKAGGRAKESGAYNHLCTPRKLDENRTNLVHLQCALPRCEEELSQFVLCSHSLEVARGREKRRTSNAVVRDYAGLVLRRG